MRFLSQHAVAELDERRRRGVESVLPLRVRRRDHRNVEIAMAPGLVPEQGVESPTSGEHELQIGAAQRADHFDDIAGSRRHEAGTECPAPGDRSTEPKGDRTSRAPTAMSTPMAR